MTTLLVSLAAALVMAGCSERPKPPRPTPVLLVTETYQPLLERLLEEGVRVEKAAAMKVVGTTTREAIVAMINDSVATICVDRPLNGEERTAAETAEMKVTENRIADDALVVIVHPLNPLKELSLASLRRIVHGDAADWSAVAEAGWSGGIDLTLTGRNSGTYELLHQTMFPSERPPAVSHPFRTQAEVVAYVAGHPQSVGLVSLQALPDLPGTIRIVRMEATNKEYPEKFVGPSQRNIYLGLYPLRYSLYLYTTERRPEEGSAFSTFVLKLAGQKVIQNAGLVPADIPSRSIQITSESYE